MLDNLRDVDVTCCFYATCICPPSCTLIVWQISNRVLYGCHTQSPMLPKCYMLQVCNIMLRGCNMPGYVAYLQQHVAFLQQHMGYPLAAGFYFLFRCNHAQNAENASRILKLAEPIHKMSKFQAAIWHKTGSNVSILGRKMYMKCRSVDTSRLICCKNTTHPVQSVVKIQQIDPGRGICCKKTTKWRSGRKMLTG